METSRSPSTAGRSIEAVVRNDISLDESYDAYPRIEEAFREFLDESLHPRGPDALFDLIGSLGLPEEARAVDVGCGEGAQAMELAARFGFVVQGVDPVQRHIEISRQALARADPAVAARVRFDSGRAEDLPLGDGTVDLIWCREALMYAELGPAFAEFRRVLRSEGHGLVCQVLTGPRMSDDEAAEFWNLGARASSVRPAEIEEAIRANGLRLVHRTEFSSEWGERAEETEGAGTRRLLHAARLLRDPERFAHRFGEAAYQIMLGDCLWHVYRMIGKLTGCAFLFTSPPG